MLISAPIIRDNSSYGSLPESIPLHVVAVLNGHASGKLVVSVQSDVNSFDNDALYLGSLHVCYGSSRKATYLANFTTRRVACQQPYAHY